MAWPYVAFALATGIHLVIRQVLKEEDCDRALRQAQAQALCKKLHENIGAYVQIHQGDKIKKGYIGKIEGRILWLYPNRPMRNRDGHLCTPPTFDEFSGEEIDLGQITDVKVWIRRTKLYHYAF